MVLVIWMEMGVLTQGTYAMARQIYCVQGHVAAVEKRMIQDNYRIINTRTINHS
jgi:hypothetical protein